MLTILFTSSSCREDGSLVEADYCACETSQLDIERSESTCLRERLTLGCSSCETRLCDALCFFARIASCFLSNWFSTSSLSISDVWKGSGSTRECDECLDEACTEAEASTALPLPLALDASKRGMLGRVGDACRIVGSSSDGLIS